MSDDIRVNGNAVSWGSISMKAATDAFTGFTQISYADKRERVKLHGMGRHQAARGRSRGKYTTDPVKVKGPKGTAEAFRDFLARQAVDGISIGDVEFPIVLLYIEPGSEKPMNVLIEGCVLVSDSSSHEEGADPLFDELEFDCMKIYRNGRTLFDSSTGAP